MTDRMEQVQKLFVEALEQPADRRNAWLVEQCADDVGLLKEVLSLLRHDHSANDPLEKGVALPEFAGAENSDEPSATVIAQLDQTGTTIGPYKLLQRIGEGGMGTVYMAEQERPVRRRVALKIIKPGLDTKQVIARFEAERQALAMMDHHHIARVLDAGATEQGHPYFAMELVKGIPITKYCDDNKLTLSERLELFIPVCHAIQHAHQKGIIHRDIKPSNVLVCMYDGIPVPKVIDFGVAKATHQKLTEKTMFTALGQVVGTLEYMSPEQAEMNQLDVDTRSDIYSLGVLLYELLTGTTPITGRQLREVALAEMLRTIREVEPPKPSTRLSESGDALPQLSATRRIEPAKLSRLLRGDLDWIVMKALEKDRSRRYETANGLALDIKRHLSGDPVEAGPPSAGYRLRKIFRKHRTLVGGTVAVMAVVLLGFGIVSVLLQKALNAEAVASRALEGETVAREDAEESQAEAERLRERAERESQRANQEAASARASLVDLSVQMGVIRHEQNRPADAALWFLRAAETAPEGSRAEAVNRERAARWSELVPRTLAATMRPGAAIECEFHPLRRYLLVQWQIADRYELAVWDIARDAFLISRTGNQYEWAWSPDGRWLALLNDVGLVILSTEDWSDSFIDSPENVRCLCWTSDSRSLVVAGDDIRLLRADPFRYEAVDVPVSAPIQSLVINTTGTRCVAVTAEKVAHLFAMPDWAKIGNAITVQGVSTQRQPVFMADGAILTCPVEQGSVALFDSETGTKLESFTPATGKAIDRIQSHPLSGTASLTAFPSAYVFDINRWRHAQSFHQRLPTSSGKAGPPIEWTKVVHSNHVKSVAAHPDSETLITVGDRTCRVWTAGAGRIATLKTTAGAKDLTVAPDGQLFAIAQSDGLVRIVEYPHRPHRSSARKGLSDRNYFGVTDDGVAVTLSSRGSRYVEFLDAATLEECRTPLGLAGEYVCGAISRDGRWLLTVCRRSVALGGSDGGGLVQLWSVRNGMPSEVRRTDVSSCPFTVAFSSGNERAISLNAEGRVDCFEVPTGEHRVFRNVLKVPEKSALCPDRTWTTFLDERRFLVHGVGPAVFEIDARTGEAKTVLIADSNVFGVDVSRDGERWCFSTIGGTVEIRSAGDHSTLAIAKIADWVFQARFDPAGKAVAIASRADAYYWPFCEGDPPTALSHPDEVFDAVFANEGKCIVTADRDHRLRIWDASSAQLVCPPVPLGERCTNLAVGGSSTEIVVASFGRYVESVNTSYLPRSIVGDWAKFLPTDAAMMIQSSGTELLLSGEQWFRTYRDVVAHHGPRTLPDVDDATWYACRASQWKTSPGEHGYETRRWLLSNAISHSTGRAAVRLALRQFELTGDLDTLVRYLSHSDGSDVELYVNHAVATLPAAVAATAEMLPFWQATVARFPEDKRFLMNLRLSAVDACDPSRALPQPGDFENVVAVQEAIRIATDRLRTATGEEKRSMLRAYVDSAFERGAELCLRDSEVPGVTHVKLLAAITQAKLDSGTHNLSADVPLYLEVGRRIRARPESGDRHNTMIWFAHKSASFAETLLERGEYDASVKISEECIRVRRETMPNTWMYSFSRCVLAFALSQLGREEEADTIFVEAFPVLEQLWRQKEMPDRNMRQVVQWRLTHAKKVDDQATIAALRALPESIVEQDD